MAISKKQQELDVIKWEKSRQMNADACGTFDYCEKCDKTLENPCDKAYKKFNKKPAAKKSTAKEVAATACVEKKPACKTAKKK